MSGQLPYEIYQQYIHMFKSNFKMSAIYVTWYTAGT